MGVRTGVLCYYSSFSKTYEEEDKRMSQLLTYSDLENESGNLHKLQQGQWLVWVSLVRLQ